MGCAAVVDDSMVRVSAIQIRVTVLEPSQPPALACSSGVAVGSEHAEHPPWMSRRANLAPVALRPAWRCAAEAAARNRSILSITASKDTPASVARSANIAWSHDLDEVSARTGRRCDAGLPAPAPRPTYRRGSPGRPRPARHTAHAAAPRGLVPRPLAGNRTASCPDKADEPMTATAAVSPARSAHAGKS